MRSLFPENPVLEAKLSRGTFLRVSTAVAGAMFIHAVYPKLASAAEQSQPIQKPKDPNLKPIIESVEDSILGRRQIKFDPNNGSGDLITIVRDDVFKRLAVMGPDAIAPSYAIIKDQYQIPGTNLLTETHCVRRIGGREYFQILTTVGDSEPPFGAVITQHLSMEMAERIKLIAMYWDHSRVSGFGLLDDQDKALPVDINVRNLNPLVVPDLSTK